MVFICAPLSRRAIQLSPLIFTLATFLTPYQCWKRSGFKKGVCVHHSTPLAPPLGASLVWPLLSERSGLPSLMPSPPCSFKMWICSRCFYQWAVTDKVLQTATMVAMFLFIWESFMPSQDASWVPLWHLWYHHGPYCPPLHPSWHYPLPGAPSVWQAF